MADRSTTRFLKDLTVASAGGGIIVLDGNVDDLFASPTGTIVPLERLIAEWASRCGRSIVQWTPLRGTEMVTPPGVTAPRFSGPSPRAPVSEALLDLLGELHRASEPIALLIDWVEGQLPVGQEPANDIIELLASAALDPQVHRNEHLILLRVREGAAAERVLGLAGTTEIAVPLPDELDRRTFLRTLVERDQRLPDYGVAEIAAATSGLNNRQLWTRLRQLGLGADFATQYDFLETKMAAIRSLCGDALVPYSPGIPIEELPGLHSLRNLVADRRSIGYRLPHLLLAGPPGTGKTLSVNALASSLGWTAVGWGEVMSQWVGESERRLRNLTRTVEQLAPVIVHIDEIDQIIGRAPDRQSQQRDGGVSERLRGALLKWISEVQDRAEVVVVGTSNRPDLLGPEFDDRFTFIPILPPDIDTSAGIIGHTLAGDGRRTDLDAVRDLLRDHDEIMSARTLVRLCRHAVRLSDLAASKRTADIPLAAFHEALDDLIEKQDDTRAIEMTREALVRTGFRSELPWNAAAALGEQLVLPTALARLVQSA